MSLSSSPSLYQKKNKPTTTAQCGGSGGGSTKWSLSPQRRHCRAVRYFPTMQIVVLPFFLFLLIMNNVVVASSGVDSSSIVDLLMSSSLYSEGALSSSWSSSSLQESSGNNVGGGHARIVSPFSSSSSLAFLRLQQKQQQDNNDAIDWDAYHHPTTNANAFVFSNNNRRNNDNNLQVALPLQPPPPPPISSSSSQWFSLQQESSLLQNHHQHPGIVSSSAAALPSSSSSLSLRKTGTTICGVAGRYYCVLGADTRATNSNTVADKRAAKLHPLARNVWAAGAGTSADLEHITRSCHYQLKLQHVMLIDAIGNQNQKQSASNIVAATTTTSNQNEVDSDDNDDDDVSDVVVPSHVATSVSSVCRILQNTLLNGAGNVQANLILGGIDAHGKGHAMLRALHPHGSIDENLQFTALGSGGLAAMSVLEQGFYHARVEHVANKRQRRHDQVSSSDTRSDNDHDDNDKEEIMSLEQAIELVKNAIRAGIENDLGSGSQIDLCIMTKQHGTIYQRCAVAEEQLEPLSLPSIIINNNNIDHDDNADADAHYDNGTSMPLTPESSTSSSLHRQGRIVSLAPQQEIQAKEDLWTKVLGL